MKEAQNTQQMLECLKQISRALRQFLGNKTNISDDEIKVRLRHLILIVADRLLDVEINASINDLIVCLPEDLDADLAEDKPALSYVFMQVSSLLKPYLKIKTFLDEITQSRNVTLRMVEEHLRTIEARVRETLVDLRDLQKYPFPRHLQLVADALTAIIHKISQDCKEVVNILSGQDKEIIARLNRILTSLGFSQIDLKVEMNTDGDLGMARKMQDQEQLRASEELARRLQNEDDAPLQQYAEVPEEIPAQLAQLQADEELARRLQDEEDAPPQAPQNHAHRDDQRQPQNGSSCIVQ